MSWRPPDPVVGPRDGPHRHDVTPVGRAIDRLLDGFGAPPADTLGAVFDRWSELAGSPLGEHGRPVAIEDGTLVVAVDDGTWATEWRYRQGDVLRRCDEAFGAGVVARIEARVRPRG